MDATLRVILATVREDPGELRRALDGPVRWPVLGMLAVEEKATPVLHRLLVESMRQKDPAPVDDDFIEHLSRIAMVLEFRLLELEARLGRLLEAFEEAGIGVLLLKGAALWQTRYESPVDRPMGDVDLLVDPGLADAASQLAGDLGWGRRHGLPPREAYGTHHHLPPMADRAGMELGLEIHTDIFPAANPFDLPVSEIWSRSRAVRDGGCVRVPSPEHLLLHAALHWSWSHTCSFGIWRTLRDTDRLVTGGDLDWDRFVRTAHESRGSAGAFWTLHLAHRWAGSPVDERVLQALRPGSSRLLEQAFERHLGHRLVPAEGVAWPVALDRLIWEVAMRPRARGHGAIRPWTDADKWLGEEGEAGEGGDAASGTEARAPSGFRRGTAAVRHLWRVVAGLEWPAPRGLSTRGRAQ